MNAPDKLQQLLTLTREPFPQSRKVYVPGAQPGVQVPMREIALTNGETVTVYDTSGPYTDPAAAINIRQGLAAGARAGWIAARGDTEAYEGRSRVALDDGGKHGTKFDSSKDRNQPFTIPLGAGKVIKGWDEGIVGMKEGGTRQSLRPSP